LFITLAVVLLTEAHGPVGVSFTLQRLGSTLAGGALALVAALLFWPVWERDRLRPILVKAIEANRNFLQLIAARIADGGSYDEITIAAKRRVEASNSAVFSSLQRMMGDPRNRRAGLEQIAAYANGNQRITRAFTVLALQLTPGTPLASASVVSAFQQLDGGLEHLVRLLRSNDASAIPLAPLPPPRLVIPAAISSSTKADQREHEILLQLNRIATELRAMGIAGTSDKSVANLQATSATEPADREARV
jgi:uncharacterized membrane protein YccC